jgi:hypothetical protein
MAFDFPASPTNGQSFTPAGGKPYVWDGVAWRMSGAGITTSVIIADTPPVGVAHGTLWWESDTGNTFIFYDDGDSKQWVQFNVSSAPANVVTKTAEPYNRIVNGAMQHSQENGRGGSATSGYWVADQWSYGNGGPTSNLGLSAAGNPNSLQMWNGAGTFSPAASSLNWIIQKIEGNRMADFGWGTASAKSAVLRFTAWVSAAAAPFVFGAVVKQGGSHSFVQNFTATATPTEFVMPIPGPTIGTWPTDTAESASIAFCSMAGSNYITSSSRTWVAGHFFAATGVGNLFSASNQGLNIANVGLYLDPNATGVAPPWVMPDYASELATCQRYYSKGLSGLDGWAGANGAAWTWRQPLPMSMRVNPTVTNTTSGTPSNCSFNSLDTLSAQNFRYVIANTNIGGFGINTSWVASARM